jgi:hypothetical protein
MVGPADQKWVVVMKRRAYPIDTDTADVAKCRQCGRGVTVVLGDGQIGLVPLDPPTQGVVA